MLYFIVLFQEKQNLLKIYSSFNFHLLKFQLYIFILLTNSALHNTINLEQLEVNTI